VGVLSDTSAATLPVRRD